MPLPVPLVAGMGCESRITLSGGMRKVSLAQNTGGGGTAGGGGGGGKRWPGLCIHCQVGACFD